MKFSIINQIFAKKKKEYFQIKFENSEHIPTSSRSTPDIK